MWGQNSNYFKMKSKYFLFLGLGATIVSLTAFASKKKKQMERIIHQLQFKLVSIKNLHVSFKELALDIDIKAVNPTSDPLYLNTGFISAKMLRVYEKNNGKLLAFSKLNTHKISIPSGGFYQLPTIHIKIPLLIGGQLIVSQLLKGQQSNAPIDFVAQLAFELELTALGKTQIIKF